MHACIYLLMSLIGTAGLYFTLGADFLGATQLVVYVGGVVILMLFAVMLTGGGALLGDLDLALREQTGLAISVADESLNCVALGTGKSLEFEKQLAHVIDYGS